MSQFSSYTSKFRANEAVSSGPSTSRVIKRQRNSLVCTQCRISKTRCDRAQPCSSCVNRNVPEGCDYQRNEPSGLNAGNLDQVGHKLAHLESIVQRLADSQTSIQTQDQLASQEHGMTQHEQQHQLETFNSTTFDQPNSASYTGSTHWTAVLDDLQELSALLQTSSERQDTGNESAMSQTGNEKAAEPIFGAFSNFSLPDIIAEFLPAKADVDRLLSLYFQGPAFITPLLHMHHFQRQYRDFWVETSEAKPLWLSILFSICYVSSEARKVTDPNAPPLKTGISSNLYLHVAAGKCLVLGDFNRPQELTVEALTMYAQSKHIQSLDPSREAGLVLSIAVRTAYQLGYHRDPDSSGSLSAFEGEMRRRCWATCKQLDLKTSFELGLPSNICLENCDTRSLRNLSDSDFDEDTVELPNSRSENEATRILWFIVKDRMMDSFSKVCRDALSFHVKSDTDVFRLDEEIRQMYDTVPPVLRFYPLSESLAETPLTIFCRIWVEFIHLKSLCVLHRRYMARGSVSSTASCIDAGTRLVSYFIDIAKESSPGGQLYMHRWMLTAYTVNDFLLGVMVLCFAIHTHRRKHRLVSIDSETEILALLDLAYTILIQKFELCTDARRVAHIVRLTLDNPRTSRPTSSQGHLPAGIAQNFEPTRHQTFGDQDNEPFSASLEPFTFMNDPTGEFDWSLFDLEAFNRDTF